jgi:hypothetical protein
MERGRTGTIPGRSRSVSAGCARGRPCDAPSLSGLEARPSPVHGQRSRVRTPHRAASSRDRAARIRDKRTSRRVRRRTADQDASHTPKRCGRTRALPRCDRNSAGNPRRYRNDRAHPHRLPKRRQRCGRGRAVRLSGGSATRVHKRRVDRSRDRRRSARYSRRTRSRLRGRT